MVEYIEREAAIKAIKSVPDGNWRSIRYAKEVKAIPAADVVSVVRCRDCEHGKKARVNEKGFLICPASNMEITGNDYCSYGARMDMVTDCNQIRDGDGE